MKKIEMGKKYTCGGEAGEVRYVDGKRLGLPVLWERNDGALFLFGECGTNHGLDSSLVEISPYADIPIDTPGWARIGSSWYPRYFAGVDNSGKPLTWDNGTTSFSSDGRKAIWEEFTTSKPEGVE